MPDESIRGRLSASAQLDRMEKLVRDTEDFLRHEAEFRSKYAEDFSEAEEVEIDHIARRVARNTVELKQLAARKRVDLASKSHAAAAPSQALHLAPGRLPKAKNGVAHHDLRVTAQIPPELLDGLKKLDQESAVPTFLPRRLEAFLTDLGLYRSSMTPEDAWNTLRKIRDENRPGQSKKPRVRKKEGGNEGDNETGNRNDIRIE